MNIGVRKVVPASLPSPHTQGGRTVGRLIDSDGSVKGGRLETFMPSGGHWHSGRVLVGARSRIAGYRPGAMMGNDLVDFRSDLVQG